MTRNPFTGNPLLLGFEEVERLIDGASKGSGYPPYNIEESGTNGWRVTLAVAGFGPQDLSVTVENRHLVIRGSRQTHRGARIYLHQGIAARSFERSFALARGVDVSGASLADGLLHIDLTRTMPEDPVHRVRIETR